MPPPELMDDAVGEVLLRFPPDEPELLVRAALVSKRWYRLISDPGFRRRFREFHRTPPVLGCFYIRRSVTGFVSTTSVLLPNAVRGDCCAMDARHGRVVLGSTDPLDDYDHNDGRVKLHLVVWDPVTDEQVMLPDPPAPPGHVFPFSCTWTAAVLCAAAGGGCNNDIDCHHGSFLVVFLCTGSRETFTCVYSLDSGGWSGPTSVLLRHASVKMNSPSVLVGNALYYVSGLDTKRGILKHDLGKQETSLIRLSRTPYKDIVLTAMPDGGLGFAAVYESKLHFWSREPGRKAYAGWRQNRVLELDTLLQPIGALPHSLELVSVVDGITAIFRGKDVVVITNLRTRRIMTICHGSYTFNIVPYTSFYTPALN